MIAQWLMQEGTDFKEYVGPIDLAVTLSLVVLLVQVGLRSARCQSDIDMDKLEMITYRAPGLSFTRLIATYFGIFAVRLCPMTSDPLKSVPRLTEKETPTPICTVDVALIS